MNVLVTGGAGFIGSHLIAALLKKGDKVICADKLVMGSQNIKQFIDHPDFILYPYELSNMNLVNQIFSENSIDMVYHLAANSDIQKGGQEPSIDFNDTFLTTRTVLEGMRKSHVKKLFFSSTSAVYGEMLDIELSEMSGGLMPISYYGGAKLASEALISSYVSMCDMSAVLFRFPNVIGPNLTHGVIFDFIAKLKDNSHQLTIMGDGSQCKPYIYIDDLVMAIMQLTSEIMRGETVYNIGSIGEGTTVTQIAEIVVAEMGLKDVKFIYTGGNRGWKGDVPRFKYNISKVLSTGWHPKYTSEEAVRQTVKENMEHQR